MIVHQLVTNHGIRQYRGAPPKYWIICGSLFVIYTAASYISMEMVSTEAEIMTMVLIRFLWPLFTLVLTIPILKKRASAWLTASVAVSLCGIIIAKMGGSIHNPGQHIPVPARTQELYPKTGGGNAVSGHCRVMYCQCDVDCFH